MGDMGDLGGIPRYADNVRFGMILPIWDDTGDRRILTGFIPPRLPRGRAVRHV